MTYHFVGIGGVSMSGIAMVLLNRGEKVTGSDRQESEDVTKLRAVGAEVFIGHSADNIKNPDVVVHTAAVKKDNPELVEAKKRGIPCVDRAAFLGEMMRDFASSIAISGTHGKTTTTGMVACIAVRAGIDPTVMIGGNLPQIDGNIKIGDNNLLVLEACEYVDSFLSFNPSIAIITNIEADHLDYFSGGMPQIRDSFQKFLERLPEDGFAVVNKDNKNAAIVAGKAGRRTVYVSLADPTADYFARDLEYSQGKARFKVIASETKQSGDFEKTLDCRVADAPRNDIEIELNVFGEHNVYNALCAFAACHQMGIAPEIIAKGLASFVGTGRRFEYRGIAQGISLYDDYAHHPTELETTWTTAENLSGENFFVFQPHTYTRTKALWDDFILTLKKPKNLIIADIYSARENPIKGITSEELARACGAEYIDGTLEEIAEALKTRAKTSDNIITIGAGDVNKICDMFLKN